MKQGNKLTPKQVKKDEALTKKMVSRNKKRLVKGKDWHKYAVRIGPGKYWNMTFENKPKTIFPLTFGEIVRVKFVEV